jgi:DNA polymerase
VDHDRDGQDALRVALDDVRLLLTGLRLGGLEGWIRPLGGDAPADAPQAAVPPAEDLQCVPERKVLGEDVSPLLPGPPPGGEAEAASAPEPSPRPGADPSAALEAIREDLGDCTRCRLHIERGLLVFGEGSPRAPLVFVGEGPGFEEDRQGRPFVGKAGKLLEKMIHALGLWREDVYICNVVKCRPPKNRTPSPDEIAVCSPFLLRQLEAIRPQVICALGACAAQTLLESSQPISAIRKNIHRWRGIPLAATYHPAYLLRNPAQKAAVWKDLLEVRKFLI